MRACFLRQSVCTLGFGVAIIQTPVAEDKAQPDLSPESDPELPTVPWAPVPNRMFAALKRQPHFS